MKTKSLKPLLLLFFCLPVLVYGQIDCSQNDFTDSLYTVESETFRYASKPNQLPAGAKQNLEAEVFYPVEHTGVKPLIMLAYGGAFVAGEKEDMSEFAAEFASRGYVATTFDYRLYNLFWGNPTPSKFVKLAFNAVDDMAEATDSMIARADRYNIDTTSIFLGGVSAGAIMSIHLTAVDSLDPLDSLIRGEFSARPLIGAFNKANVKGILNLSGAIYDTTYLDNETIPMISMHGDMDETVNIDYGLAAGILNLYGSRPIHERLDKIGTLNYLKVIEGGGHSDIYLEDQYTDQFNDFRDELEDFFSAQLCDGTFVNTISRQTKPIDAFPNPFQKEVSWEMPQGSQPVEIQVIDLLGKVVYRQKITSGTNRINLSFLSKGMYLFQVKSNDGKLYQKKMVKA